MKLIKGEKRGPNQNRKADLQSPQGPTSKKNNLPAFDGSRYSLDGGGEQDLKLALYQKD